ncbi:MAG: D-glycero-beta-D-manno-heptose 1-phosphate adenylyltransferase [Pseudomonadota bacterium]
MSRAELRTLIASTADQRIVCLGDVMLDDFVYGTVSRVSPEAPVPVLRETHRRQMPGGAANTARNAAALGAKTRLVGAIGPDPAGEALRTCLAETTNIDAALVEAPEWQTVTKTRFVCGGQQLMRLDQEASPHLAYESEQELVGALKDASVGAGAILVSDYAKGTVTADIMREVIRCGLAQDAVVIVDPKGADLSHYGPVDLIKPNASELALMTGLPTGTHDEVERALLKAMSLSSAKAILVTRAAKGLSFLQRGREIRHMSGRVRDVFDVSGAGDTSLAALGLALSAGASLEDAGRLALLASGLAVTKAGTATVSREELFAEHATQILSLDAALQTVSEWRSGGLSVGFTNGCFDILHPGHLRVLEEAKARCDRLLVGLNSDGSVRRLKGDDRPVNDQSSRARVLSGLSAVDGIVVFEDDTPETLITHLQPDLLVKGGDYTIDTIVGAETVLARGGQVHIVPLLEGHSTTATIARSKGGA